MSWRRLLAVTAALVVAELVLQALARRAVRRRVYDVRAPNGELLVPGAPGRPPIVEPGKVGQA